MVAAWEVAEQVEQVAAEQVHLVPLAAQLATSTQEEEEGLRTQLIQVVMEVQV